MPRCHYDLVEMFVWQSFLCFTVRPFLDRFSNDSRHLKYVCTVEWGLRDPNENKR